MDLEWIEDTPADEFEYGEEMIFSHNYRWINGTYERQEGDVIYIRITEETNYRLGMDEVPPTIGTIEGFPRDTQMFMSSLFSGGMATFQHTEWTEYDWDITIEKLLEDDIEDIYNPTTIGRTNTTIKGKNHIDKRNTKPRDNPTINERI
jgi:hypothetical protein